MVAAAMLIAGAVLVPAVAVASAPSVAGVSGGAGVGGGAAGRGGVIDGAALIHAARVALDGGATASSFPASGGPSSHEATMALNDLANALPRLRGAQRRAARQILLRPTNPSDDDVFSGPEAVGSPACSTNFCVHWTDVGVDSPSLVDVDPLNGLPDYVDEVLAVSEFSFDRENIQLGWIEPVSDGTAGGGSGLTDVYLSDIGNQDLFGYAAQDPGQGIKRHKSAYLVIDNNFSQAEFPEYSDPILPLEVTLAHEYNHVLQNAYAANQDKWLFESTATWMEEKVYPDVNDYVSYVPRFADGPQLPITQPKSREYGVSVFTHWISGRFGDDTIRAAWEASGLTSPVDYAVGAYGRAIRAASGSSSSFDEEFGRFAAATAEWRVSSAFPDPTLYPDVTRAGALNSRGVRVKMDHTAYRLYKVNARGRYSVTLSSHVQTGTRSAIALVGRRDDSGPVVTKIKFAKKGGSLRVKLNEARSFKRITAVLVNTDGRISGFGSSDWNYLRDKSLFTAAVR